MWDQSSSIFTMPIETRPILEDITIVIPTLGRPILEQCLYWIAVGSAWPANLILVDQGANEDVENWVQHLRDLGLNASRFLSKQTGRSAGINRGLEQVKTRFVAITDDDCFVEPDWLLNMTLHLREAGDVVVTGRVEAAGDDMIVVVTSTIPAVHTRPRLKFDSMSGGNMGTSMQIVNRVGLFDEDPCTRTAEDAEWSYRALRKGVPIAYTPDVCLRHYGWRDSTKRAEQYRSYARSHGGFYGKYIRKGDFFIFLRAVLHHYRAARRWLYGKVRGDIDSELLGKAYFTGLVPGIIAGIKSKFGIVQSNG